MGMLSRAVWGGWEFLSMVSTLMNTRPQPDRATGAKISSGISKRRLQQNRSIGYSGCAGKSDHGHCLFPLTIGVVSDGRNCLPALAERCDGVLSDGHIPGDAQRNRHASLAETNRSEDGPCSGPGDIAQVL